jgi:hypothetical protein
MTDFLAELGGYPTNHAAQVDFFNRLKVLLQSVNTKITDSAAAFVTLKQATEPTQLEWETAWVAQTGKALPILPNATLYWINATTNTFGGTYGVLVGSSTVIRKESAFQSGSTFYVGSSFNTDYVSAFTGNIGTSLTSFPTLTFTAPVTSNLLLDFSLYVNLASGSGNWGIDFLLNGVKVGTQYLGAALNQGIVNSNRAGHLQAMFVATNVPPGTHTVQALFGVTGSPGSPPTLQFGGLTNFGARTLLVRGVAV